jgi:hypothetical protein
MSDLPTVPPRAKGNRVAVLCGIARYSDRIAFPRLARVADEIEGLRELLTTGLHPDFRFQLHGDTVYRDDQLTKEQLLKLLIDLRESRNTELLFFYLAGHGHQHESDTYFLTYDASPPFLANPGVRLAELRHYLNRLGPRATIAVLDFCHAGAIPLQDLDRLSIFASSQGDQVADAGGTSSSFTERLIGAIRSAAPDEYGYVRWDRIADRAQGTHQTSLVAKPKYAAGTLGDCEFDWRPAPQGGEAKVIVARQREATSPAAAGAIPPDALPCKALTKDHYSALAVRWVDEKRIVFATRGSDVFLVEESGAREQIGNGGAVPSFVSVSGDLVAVMCYTDLRLYHLAGGAAGSVVFEEHAGGNIAEWSPSGEYIAAAGTNCIKVYRRDLTEVAGHHVGGKHGSSALAWTGDVLWVGLSDGELWKLEPPFNAPRVVTTREEVKVLALRVAAEPGRLACYWFDGRLEVREGENVLASVQTEPQTKWAGHGPKLAWCLGGTVLAVTNGLGAEILFWDTTSGALLTCRLPREVEALDAAPPGAALALGIGESPHRRDGEVWVADLTAVPGLFANPAPAAGTLRPHLLKADWTPILDAVEGANEEGAAVELPDVRLDIVPLRAEFERYEQAIRASGAGRHVLRELEKGLRRERRRAESILADLFWLAHQMRLAFYHELYVEDALDMAASYLANAVLGSLGVADFPQLGSLEEFVAYSLGCEKEDVILLGFDTADGRGMVAGVPTRFLIQVRELARMGEAALAETGVLHAPPRDIVTAAAARYHIFDLLFDGNSQREMWARYVLPLALARYPKEQIVVKPSEIERFGLT